MSSTKFTPGQFDAKNGYYGPEMNFGGQYVPEILLPALDELEEAFETYRNDSEFLAEFEHYKKNLIGRPSPLIYAKNLTEKLGGAKIYLKNEGNNFTGSHKINHCIYHALLAKRMGKTKIIAETGAGQHGLAVATVCSIFGLEAKIFMGQKNLEKQYPNVFWMKQLGAEVIPVTSGNQKLTDAADAVLGEWITDPSSYFMLGSVVGPHPFPEIVREAQKIVGKEIKKQINEFENKNPDYVVACIGGGSNAIGAFNEFLYDEETALIGVEAGGKSVDKLGEHASRLASGQGKIGVFEGFKSYFLMDENGQIADVDGISAGLDYSGIGPIHSYLYELGRIQIKHASDEDVLEAFKTLAKTEGILPALESSHAVTEAMKLAPTLEKDKILVVNLSGRADNYIFNVANGLKDKEFETFCNNFKLK